MKSLVVYNKFASRNKAGKLVNEIKASFEKNSITPELFFADNAEQAFNHIIDTNLKNYDNVLCVGGDGTLFQVINASMNKPPSERIPVGLIPIGTGNAFARDVNLIPNNFNQAISAISKFKTRKIDIGKFSSSAGSHYFSNIIGFGFVTDVAQTANKLKIFGKISYTLGVIYHVAYLKPFNIVIEYDGKTIEREIIFIEISNTRYTGSDFIMAPNAIIDDGLFDVTILTKTTRGRILRSLPKIFTGSHIHLDVIETFRASALKISTEEPKALTPDGEIFGSTPIEINCLPGEIDFIVG